jgi:hypothetical protein
MQPVNLLLIVGCWDLDCQMDLTPKCDLQSMDLTPKWDLECNIGCWLLIS